MSEELVRVSIELAWEYDFLVLFVASRNQVSEEEGGGYVYDEKVREAIKRLYSSLKRHKLFENPEAYVIRAVKKAIMRYLDAFNLRGSSSKILKNIS